jgi:quaternary ammonium compound-resistance protein SugE
MAWVYLLAAGLFEIGFTTALRYVTWPPRPIPILAFLVFSVSSFGLLVAAMKSIPIGTAYAVWTGIGAAGTVLVGLAFYDEPTTTLRLVFLTTLIASIVGLKLVSG